MALDRRTEMMLWLALALVTATPPTAPAIPVGVHEAFARNIATLQREIEAGRFDRARARLNLLPKPQVTIGWDETGVPAGRREEFRQARQLALGAWRTALPQLKVTFAPRGGDIRISFKDALPVPPDGALPAGAVFFLPQDPKEPFVEGVLALHRTYERRATTGREVAAELAYAIGAYLGLERRPPRQGVMGRSDGFASAPPLADVLEMRLARETLRLSDALRDAVANKRRLRANIPGSAVARRTLTAPPVAQGETLVWTLTVTNPGSAPLRINLTSDCSSFAFRYDPRIEPGQTRLVRIEADTTNFPGPFERKILLYANDPEQPVRTIDVTTTVRPTYRFLRAERGWTAAVEPERPARQEFFLVVDPEQPLRPLSAKLEGASGQVSFEPWEGILADEDLGEGPAERKGYRIVVEMTGPPLGAQTRGTVLVETDRPKFRFLRRSLTLQAGIVATPGSLELGRLGRQTRRTWIAVSRPGQPFRVTKVSSDLASLRVSTEAGSGEVRILVEYDGSAELGVLEGSLTIHTDDPRQPQIKVPVSGMVVG